MMSKDVVCVYIVVLTVGYSIAAYNYVVNKPKVREGVGYNVL